MQRSPRIDRLLSLLGFPALLAVIAGLAYMFRAELFGLFRSAEAIRQWVESRGALAPLAFAGLQAIQVIVFFIPGEIVQIAGGFAFGALHGTLWSLAGILAGSVVNFGIGRLFGRPFVEAVFGVERTRRVDAATAGGKAAAGFFLLFAIPGIPKDLLTYAAGASALPFGHFIVVSTLGRLPGIVGSSYMGAAVFKQNYLAATIVVCVALALFVLGLVFRDKLHDLVARIIAARHRSGR